MGNKVTHISGKRWFQKTYGNTYHTATLHFADGSSETSKKQYGYNDQYLQTAYEMMGKEYKGTIGLRGMGVSYDVSDVARERDL
jgi:hypothetical protein